jgi:membrane-bound lytic murein transglycosylase A
MCVARRLSIAGSIAAALLLALTTARANDPAPAKANPGTADRLPAWFRLPGAQFKPVTWNELVGWQEDDHAAAFVAFLKSCNVIVEGGPPRPAARPFYAALRAVCRRALKQPAADREAARVFFESNFHPVRIMPRGQSEGFLTGYYEPIIEGSRQPNGKFTVPLYRTPPDLRKPYFDRAKIEDGVLAGRNLEICWLKDPTDLFFAQIQGSARVKLEDGRILRLNYSSQNGWPYTPIGAILIRREIVPREEMSMQRIREWIEANPKEGRELRRRNKSFVFFRETGYDETEEPVGAQGVHLTPGRSIAVDRFIHVYGTPFFIEAELPLDGERCENPLRRLWIAQDTGGAIRGPARADLYFGAGDGHAAVAGRIRHPGRFTMLVPRDIEQRPVFAPRRRPPETPSDQPAVDQNPEAGPRRE